LFSNPHHRDTINIYLQKLVVQQPTPQGHHQYPPSETVSSAAHTMLVQQGHYEYPPSETGCAAADVNRGPTTSSVVCVYCMEVLACVLACLRGVCMCTPTVCIRIFLHIALSVNNWHDSVNNRHDSVNNWHDSVNNWHQQLA
jgi:hypothetical protein